MDLHFLTLEQLIIANHDRSALTLSADETAAVMRMIGYGPKTMTEVAIELDRADTERRSSLQHGDRVLDPMDGEWRTVRNVENAGVYTEDGGCMYIDDCRDVLLPGEEAPDHVYLVEFQTLSMHVPANSAPHAWSLFAERNDLLDTYGHALPEGAQIKKIER